MNRFRAESERKFANSLTRERKKWMYEPKRFKINDTHYVPDFYLPDEDLYIELLNSTSINKKKKEKIDALNVLYPSIKIIVICCKYKKYFDSEIRVTTKHTKGKCNRKTCVQCRDIRNYWRRKQRGEPNES